METRGVSVLSKIVLGSCLLRRNTEQVGLGHRQHLGRKRQAAESFCYHRFRTSQTAKGNRNALGTTWGTNGADKTGVAQLSVIYTHRNMSSNSSPPVLLPSVLYVPQNKVCP